MNETLSGLLLQFTTLTNLIFYFRITIIHINTELFKIYIHDVKNYYYYLHSIILLYICRLLPKSKLTNMVRNNLKSRKTHKEAK